ncbi:MAG: type I 3-dehydroquinate dehydratase [Candidatus Bathycorpusculaceae bacterium]
MNIKVCVPIVARKPSEIPTLIKKAENAGANLAEIRLDYLEDFNGLEKAVEDAKIPLIATNRQYEQSGKRKQNEDERLKTLLEFADKGFSIVDIETTISKLKSIVKSLKKKDVETIISFHDFNKTPNLRELRRVATSQIKAGADICKIVTKANDIGDNLTCLSLVSEISQKMRIVCFAMGSHGVLSRILSPMFGANFTYASLERGMETAPGQMSITWLKEIYKCLGVEGI